MQEGWLGLKPRIPQRDVRKLVWKLLAKFDYSVIRVAHNLTFTPPFNGQFEAHCARHGHLKLLQWARSKGASLTETTCALAAHGGYLELLQWARSQVPPIPWNSLTCSYAARGGFLEVLQWARGNGAPWDEWTCAYAAGGKGHRSFQDPLC